MYITKSGTNVAPSSVLAYKILRILVIGSYIVTIVFVVENIVF